MNYLLLIAVVILLAGQNFIAKQYNIKAKAFNIWMFSGMTTLGALVFFLLNAKFQVSLVWEVLPFSIGFALFYGSATVGSVLAVRKGMFSLSTLVSSYSLIIPTLYGIIFLNDPIGWTGYVGILLLMASIYLLNKKDEEVKFSVAWLIWVAVGFIGNGFCSTVQKMQQLHFDGGYKNELMIYSLAMLTVFFMVMGIVTGKELGKEAKATALYGLPKGLANGVVNLLVMVLQGVLPTALLFPMISAGGIVIAFLLAVFLYREHLTKPQLVGYAIGTVSVILLNL